MNHTRSQSGAPSFIHVYDGTSPSEANARELAAFLQKKVPPSATDVRADFLCCWLAEGDKDGRRALQIGKSLAQARVRRPESRRLDPEPLQGAIDFEMRFLSAGSTKPAGILYDGHRLIAVYAGLLAPEETNPEHCHIVLTNQLFGTWDGADHRYHARAAIYGFPSLVSTSGLIAAPARPREFYLAGRLGAARVGLQGDLKGRYLESGDPRLQEALKGYLLQAVFYHVTGEPFCRDKECRLLDAHWQEELIHAQIRPQAGLCERHGRMLEEWSCG